MPLTPEQRRIDILLDQLADLHEKIDVIRMYAQLVVQGAQPCEVDIDLAAWICIYLSDPDKLVGA